MTARTRWCCLFVSTVLAACGGADTTHAEKDGASSELAVDGGSSDDLSSSGRTLDAGVPSSSSGLAIAVKGNQFVDGAGHVVQLRGANVSGLETAAVQGWDPGDPWGGQDPSFDAMKTWKMNVIRLPLNEASWLGYECADDTGKLRDPDPGHNYQATVQKAVDGATAAGLYVILDLHWTAPKNFCPLAQNPVPDSDNSISFWTSIATQFKGYPNVMFELFNEPYLFYLSSGEVDWTVLMKGGTLTQYVTGDGAKYTVDYTWQSPGMQKLVDTVRATGATNVVLVSGVSWSQDLSKWIANHPTDHANQLAAVWHAYPNSGTVGDPQAALPKYGSVGYTWTQSVLDGGFPVLITEFGDHDAAGTKGSPFVSNLLPWADEHGASYLGWTWNAWSDADNVLVKDTSGTPTDGYGVYTKAHYLCVAAGTKDCP
jgi:endoglucanase